MARQYLRLTPEASWGVYAAAGTPILLPIDKANAFTLRPAPIPWEIRSAGGGNRRVQAGSQRTSCRGALHTLVYGSQAATLAPWICADAAGVLGSVTLDHAIQLEDGGTTAYRRYLGVMVERARFRCGEDDPLLRLELDLVAQQPAPISGADLPRPAATDYPGDVPYVFQHLAGGFSVVAPRAEFASFQCTITNKLDVRFMASQFPTRIKYCGRDVDLSTRFPYIVTTDRAHLEAVDPVAASMTFTNGSHTLGFAMNSKNVIAGVGDDLALDTIFLQGIELHNFFDAGAGTPNDFTLTAT
jgi:tail tube protein